MFNKKKILIFSISYLPFVGGAELAVKEITDRLSSEKFSTFGLPTLDWDMVTFRSRRKLPKFEKIGSINVYRVGRFKLFFPFAAFLKALSLHRKNNYSIIWSIMANRAGFAAFFFKFFYPKVKFLLTLQEGDTLDYPEKQAGILWPFVKFLFRRIFTYADSVQVISGCLSDWARHNGFSGTVEVVPNGVDIENFKIRVSRFKPEELKELRRKLNIKDDDKVIITTSRLVKKNAIGDVIEAMRYLPENVKFLILGTGKEEKRLKAKVEGLQGRIIFLGHILNEEVPRYLAIANVYVRPSLSEGLGTCFLEAMAAGVPVVATPVGGIPDFLKDGETGLFCEVSNPKSIAEKIIIFLENKELAGKIKIDAQEMVVKNHDWDLIAKGMNEIFRRLCLRDF